MHRLGLGIPSDDVADNGTGSFSGPFVDGEQTVLVLSLYGLAFLFVSAWARRRRDVA